MRNGRQLRKARKLQAAARQLGLLKDPALNGAEPYVEGAIDPLTGREQGPDIDKMTPQQRQFWRIPPGVTNAERRAAVRRDMAKLGFPPVGSLRELTDEEFDKLCRMMDIDPKRDELDLPCNSWQLNEEQLWKCTFWHCEVRRRAMTREEYHRLATELAGLTPDAPSSSGE